MGVKQMIITSNKINKIFFATLIIFPLFMVLLFVYDVYGNVPETIKTEIHVYKINGETVKCNGLWCDDSKMKFILYNVPDLHIHDILQIEIDTNNHDIISWQLYESFTRDGKLLYKNSNIDISNNVSIYKWYKHNKPNININKKSKFIYEPY